MTAAVALVACGSCGGASPCAICEKATSPVVPSKPRPVDSEIEALDKLREALFAVDSLRERLAGAREELANLEARFTDASARADEARRRLANTLGAEIARTGKGGR